MEMRAAPLLVAATALVAAFRTESADRLPLMTEAKTIAGKPARAWEVLNRGCRLRTEQLVVDGDEECEEDGLIFL